MLLPKYILWNSLLKMYKPATLDLTPKQIKQLAKSKPIRLTHGQIGKGKHVAMLHPENHIKLSKSMLAGKGCNLCMAPGEIQATHESTMDGTGFFGDLWDGIKKAGTWLKDSGVASAVADALQPVAATVIGPKGAELARKVLKGTTGIGIQPKRKRVSRKANALHGGSFLMPHE
jgi:hypothetical protein